MAKTLRGVRSFAPATCAQCGTEWRPRVEIGGWRLIELFARSGLALIFRAVEPESGTQAAVKLLRPPFGSTAEDFERFAADVEILAGFEHPHWLRVFGGGIEEDFAWLAMEWLPGNPLAARGRMDEIETLRFGAQAASALAAAHSVGLRHRDLEITNCLLGDAHTLKVSGFAESVFYARAGDMAGTVWGRLCCAPPERIFGEPEDSRSEIYALGAILFQAITGTLPYDGDVLPEFFFERLDGGRLHFEETGYWVRRSTARLVERMLATERAQRFQSWDEVLENITDLLATLCQSGPAAPVPPRAVAAMFEGAGLNTGV